MELLGTQTLEERINFAFRPGVLTHQGLCLLIRAAFVAGEYVPLPFLVDLDENAPLGVRIGLYVFPLPSGLVYDQ